MSVTQERDIRNSVLQEVIAIIKKINDAPVMRGGGAAKHIQIELAIRALQDGAIQKRRTLPELVQIDERISDEEFFSNLRLLLGKSHDSIEELRRGCHCFHQDKHCKACIRASELELALLRWMDGVFKFVD